MGHVEDIEASRRPFNVRLPIWAIEAIPAFPDGVRSYRMKVFIAAAVLGATVDGRRVKLGQVSSGSDRGSRSYPLVFHPYELVFLREFGNEARLSRLSSIVRTAFLVGLQVPGCYDGVMTPPWQWAGTGKTFDWLYIKSMLTVTGCIWARLYEREACAVYDCMINAQGRGTLPAMLDIEPFNTIRFRLLVEQILAGHRAVVSSAATD
jgi:hypothetical protein